MAPHGPPRRHAPPNTLSNTRHSTQPSNDGAPASDGPAATEAPGVEGPAEAVAAPTEGSAAEAAPAETSGATTRDAEKKEFARVYRSTSASETDAWLDGLEAREATNPALVVKYNHGKHEGRATKESDELGDGRVKQIGANVQLSAAYLDAELEAGRAVVVGVTYTARNGNSDKTTDHWITVTGRKSGAYVFLDPAFESGEAKGTFTIDDAQGGVMEAHINGRVYTLAQVQLNTASAGNPSSVDGEKSWKQVAKDANQQFAEGTPEDKALGW